MNYAQDKYTVEYKNRSKGEMIKTPDTEHNAHQRQLRIDTFACAAIQSAFNNIDYGQNWEDMARVCYNIAEALEAERAKRVK